MTGWQTATLPEHNVMLGVSFIAKPPEGIKDAQSLNFAIPGFQAYELGQALQRTALTALERTDLRGN